MRLSHFFIDRPIFASVVSIVFVILGAVAFVRLPIAGLMSDRSVPEVAGEVEELAAAYRALGSTLEGPAMRFSFLSLGVIPALRLTNRGLVDGISFELVPVVVA